MARLDARRALVVTIDVQDGFREYPGFADVAAGCRRLLAAARILGLPAIVSEQYPRGLGASAEELALDGEPVLQKVCFSAARAEGFDRQGRDLALLCGIEAHVCVEHTAVDLLAEGMQVHVVADACGSRHGVDRECALARMHDAGAVIETVESTLFALLDGAESEHFKAVQRLVI